MMAFEIITIFVEVGLFQLSCILLHESTDVQQQKSISFVRLSKISNTALTGCVPLNVRYKAMNIGTRSSERSVTTYVYKLYLVNSF